MTNIKLLLTGGTIASAVTENGIIPCSSDNEPLLLNEFKNNYNNLNLNIKFSCETILNKLSENMELSDWEKILFYLKANSFSKYDGIIIAHGTDTLGFFANMLSVFEKDLPPVYIVSSDKVLTDETSNGNDNFVCAVKKIISAKHSHGIFVPYRNSDNEMTIHRGYQIMQSGILSNDFYSADSLPPKHKNLKNFNGFKKGVLLLNSYVGMNLSVIDLTDLTSIIIASYHGGTTNENEVSKLLKRCRETESRQPSIILASVNYSETENQYASTVNLQKYGVKTVYKKTIETAYAEELCSLV